MSQVSKSGRTHIQQTAFSQHYILQTKLGDGGYSTVWKCVKKLTKEVFAVKVIDTTDMTKKQKKRVKKEISIHQSLRHPNIIGIYEFTEDAKLYHIILEYASGGELFAAIVKAGHFNEYQASIFMQQILSGLAFIHSKKIIHRDIKPENLLLSDPVISKAVLKISDFGLAVQSKNDLTRHYGYAGTPSYMSPQMLSGEPYNRATDVWSAGTVLYILLCGYPPFYDDDSKQFKENIKRGSFEFPSPEWDSVSANAKNLVKAMLTKDYTQRIGPEDALKHDFIAKRVAPQETSTDTLDKLKNYINIKNDPNAQNKSVLHTISGGGTSIESVKSMK